MNKNLINILIVDDRPENLLAMEAVLAAMPYNLVSVQSGEEALRHLLRADFALILMDVQMPGLSGFETAKLIRARERSKHIPIIFITAISQANEHVLQGYAIGAIDYIFKPFHPDTLRLKIKEFVRIYQNHQQLKQKTALLEQYAHELERANRKLQQMEQERQQQFVLLEQLVEERTKDLRLSQEKFRKIFDASPCLISIRSLDATYLDVNERWLHYTKYSYDEIIHTRFDAINIHLQHEHQISLPQLEITQPIRNARISYQPKHGDPRDGLLSSERIEIHGETCILRVITDITDQIRMEKEMARLDRLNLIGEMAAAIAHEIRNPMTTVRGFLQISNSSRPTEYIDLMVQELDRANSIITEFLTLAKNKNTDLSLQSLNAIIEALLPLVRAEALLGDKEIMTELSTLPELMLDEKEIRQLILNLTLNGLEAMKAGGCLTIRTFAKEDEVILEVADQGEGIAESSLDKIGTPFFTTKENGTGLGLAVCYSVADRHNAVIDIQTGRDGTVFSIRFSRPSIANLRNKVADAQLHSPYL